jgi:hypothetical protein
MFQNCSNVKSSLKPQEVYPPTKTLTTTNALTKNLAKDLPIERPPGFSTCVYTALQYNTFTETNYTKLN